MVLPEYGRIIQKMVDHCLEIEDREERTKCAGYIVDVMAKMAPQQVAEKGDNRKLWDHLNMMSDFKLDIDFPCEVLSEENMHPKPEAIPYCKFSDNFRQYGKNNVEMIKTVSTMENGIEKDKLIFLIANQMKKILITQSPENATDKKVFNDIREISKGRIVIDPESYRLNEYIGVTETNEGKKKKKNKKG